MMSLNPRLQSCDVNKFVSVGSLTQKSDAELVAEVEMDDDSVLVDIDTPEALDALRQRRSLQARWRLPVPAANRGRRSQNLEVLEQRPLLRRRKPRPEFMAATA